MSIAIGLIRGFVKETITIVTWVLAIVLAYKYGAVFGQIFSSIGTELIKEIIGGALIFLSVLISGAVLNFFVDKIIRFSGFMIFDRVLGLGLGALRAVAAFVLVMPLLSTSVAEESWWKQSALVPKLQELSVSVEKYVPQAWMQQVSDIINGLSF